jgi:hypothetical protein
VPRPAPPSPPAELCDLSAVRVAGGT